MKYTDLGHGDKDLQWVMFDTDLHAVGVGSEYELDETGLADCWHGRYDAQSWTCTIVPSEECQRLTEPPEYLLTALKDYFDPIARYYYFRGDAAADGEVVDA